jgi:hypothetical protein
MKDLNTAKVQLDEKGADLQIVQAQYDTVMTETATVDNAESVLFGTLAE